MTGGIGTVSEVVDGVYTGDLAGPFCYGPGKVDAIREMAGWEGFDLSRCYGYSDSASDLPMLEAVGHPVAVNPDKALAEVASVRGWPVVVFHRKTRLVVKRVTAGVGASGLAAACVRHRAGLRRAPRPAPGLRCSSGRSCASSWSSNLGRHERLAVTLDGWRHAAVAVVVVDSDRRAPRRRRPPAATEDLAAIPGAEDLGLSGSIAGTAGGPAVLLTRRNAHLRAHARQWALPGGRVDDGEDPVATARRELLEELGLHLDETALLGALDDYPTRSGYVITPFVFWGGANPELHPHPDEVASVHRIAFRELCRPDSPRFVSIPESERPVVQIPIGGDLIHAPTGAVLLQFRRVAIEGTTERVAGYEQPVFAWR